MLSPALTFTTWIENFDYDRDVYVFSFKINGQTDKTLVIDWGDGTFRQNANLNGEITHIYDSKSLCFVSITGDLTDITELSFYYGLGPVKEITFTHLNNLKDFRIGFQRNPTEIDFSTNTKLESLDVVTSISRLDISSNPHIRYLTDITTESINKVIESLRTVIQTNSIYGGTLYLPKFNEPSGKDEIAEPHSISSVTILQQLETIYRWNIYPTAFE